MGAAMLVGGAKRERQFFDRTAANVQVLMLLLAGAALVLPAFFELINGGRLPSVGEEEVNFDNNVETMSAIIAVVLLVTYAAGLLFSLRTHRALFNPVDEAGHGE